MQNIRPKTIICDIDGTIFEHKGDISTQHLGRATILPGVLNAWKNFDIKGYNIILVTGRRESTRRETEKQLSEAGIFYDHLIMGIGGGQRILINDMKTEGLESTAEAISVIRNTGLENLWDI